MRKFSWLSTRLVYGNDARQAMSKGMSMVAATVERTLGPMGSNVAIDYELGEPRLTKDGVTVVKSITLPESLPNLGAALVKKSAHETNNFAGDGTTTSALLTSAIVKAALKSIANGYHPLKLKAGIDAASKELVDKLTNQACYITSFDDLISIARVAAGYHEPTAQMVTETLVDAEGTVMVEEGYHDENRKVIQLGYLLNRGYMSVEFLDSMENEVSLQNPIVLVSHTELTSLQAFLPLLEKIKASGQQLLLIAKDIGPEVESVLQFNFKKGNLIVCPMLVPLMDPEPILDDVFALSGMGQRISDQSQLAGLNLSDLGRMDKAIIGVDESQFIGGVGDLSKHVDELVYQKEQETDHDCKGLIQDRIDRLSGKLGVIQIGVGGGKTAMQERHDRVIDTLNSIKSALNEGTLPGSGASLYRAALSLPRQVDFELEQGYRVIREAMSLPLRRLVESSFGDFESVCEQLMQSQHSVFNVRSSVVEDCFESGILDSLRVTRLAVMHACSIAGMVISTEAVVQKERRYNLPKLASFGKKELF